MAKTIWTTALVAISLLLASCASLPTPGATTAPTPSAATSTGNLTGTTWLLDDLGGKAPVKGTSVTARFADDGTVAGSGGCNRFSGTYTASGKTLRVGEALASTMMSCDEAVMSQEKAFLTALRGARSFTVADGRLTLSVEAGSALATFTAQSQTLAGTTWQVTAYNDGASAMVSVLKGTTPTLAFAVDGTLSGTGGCNRLTGSFTASEGAVKIGPLGSTKMACAEPKGVMEQEARILAALETAATYAIEGSRLEMRTAGDAVAVQFNRA